MKMKIWRICRNGDKIYSRKNNKSFYSKYIDINDKYGYLEINEYKGKYLIEFMYNYAKIEAVVNKENINEVVLNASYILSTIKYNSNVIKIMLNEDYFTNKEERYDIFTPKIEKPSNVITFEKE